MKALLMIARVVVWIVNAIALIAMVALAFAFFLLMFGANPTAGFTQFVYSVAKPFLAPFVNIFPGDFFRWGTSSAAQVGYVNLGVIVAFFVYAIISGIVSWAYSAISSAYYRRQAEDSLSRDVAAINAASAAAAAQQAQVAAAQQAAYQQQYAAAAAQQQAVQQPAYQQPAPAGVQPAAAPQPTVAEPVPPAYAPPVQPAPVAQPTPQPAPFPPGQPPAGPPA